MAEVNDGSLLPPAVPGLDDGFELLFVDEGGRGNVAAQGTIFCLEGENVIGSRQLEVVAVALLQMGVSLPGEG